MQLADFFENFEVLAAAPGGVARLREAVLSLAVRGRLVPQDPNDEPASVLLERIAAERSQLVKEKKIKKSEPLPPVSLDEVPFVLPSSWEWTYFSELGELARGKSKHRPRNDPSLYQDGKYPLVQTGDVARANGIIENCTALYNETGLKQSRLWKKGTLCITIAANIADTARLGFDACFPDSIVGFMPFPSLGSSIYVEFFLRTAKSSLEAFAPSTAQKNINLAILEALLIPLPPLAEQKRIVEAVDRLMEQLDRLEAQQTEQRDRLQILGTTATTQLTGAAETRDRVWPLVRDRFATIYDTPENVEQLRQTILQLAVMGRLVPQDLNNDSVQTIQKLKSACELIQIGPFGSLLHASDYIENGIPLVNPQNITSEGIIPNNNKTIPIKLSGKLERYRLRKNDVIVARRGDVGRCAVVTDSESGWFCGTGSLFIRAGTSIDPHFLKLFLDSPKTRASLQGASVGATMNNLNQKLLGNIEIYLPPIAEQKRIVATVDRLMTHCDQLQTQLQTRSDRARTLLDSAIHQLSQVA